MNASIDELESKVFPAELEEIKQRRENLGLDADHIGGDPSVDQELAGLALSGGGIRSATFSLGVIQGLAKHGVLRHVDYLSTVSGGGYIGSCLSSLLNDPKNRPGGDEFPLKYTEGAEEPPALVHLRNSSNYLSAGGLLGKLRLPNLLLRGILLNLFVFLPYIMLAVFATEVLYEVGPHWDHLPVLILPSVIIFVIFAIAFPFAMRLLRNVFNWQRRNTYELWLTIPLLIAGTLLALTPIFYVTRLAIEHRVHQVVEWVAYLKPSDIWIVSGIVLAVIALFMFAGKASENANKLRGKIVLFLVGLLGPAIIFSIYLFLCLWQIDSPFIPIESDAILNRAVACEQPCLEQGAQEDISERQHTSLSQLLDMLVEPEKPPESFGDLYHTLEGRNISFWDDAVVFCRAGENQFCNVRPTGHWRDDKRVWVVNDGRQGNAALLDACPALDDLEQRRAETFADLKGKFGATVVAGDEEWEIKDWIAQNCTYFVRGSENTLRIKNADLSLFTNPRDYWFFGILAFFILLNRYFLDINTTTPHGFYRDRLSKAFLFKTKADDSTEQDDKTKLTDLNGPGTAAPYHIINVALNLQASKNPRLRGRMCDFFIFTKHYTGSRSTGYTETSSMQKYDRHLDLATAMAISGAAAAPNMGSTTHRSLVFIMTLLNIRLGYWLPNPKNVDRKYWHKKLSLGGAKPTLIWKESLGYLNERGSHVNISDGGHIENLAIYPLLKRRCKYIVAVDGEADEDMTFGGLVTLMRYARIDMGIEIEIDLEGIRKNKEGYSKDHWALGTVKYGDGEIGHLLYVKLSVTGDEPEYIRAYRSKHEEYPHESTADQFFSEDQFEAYRALGEHICEGMLGDVDKLGGFRALSVKPGNEQT